MGDYGIDRYKENLVMPTFNKIIRSRKKVDSSFTTADLKVNNNNVSHSVRLGLLHKAGNNYTVTPLGKKFMQKKIGFDRLFQKQLIKFYIAQDSKVLFPYASCLFLLSQMKRLTFLEFVYALYSLQSSSKTDLATSLNVVKYIRQTYPIVENLSQTNKKTVIADLNNRFDKEFEDTDIWGVKQTTINNQFIYFKNHLEIFGNLLEFKSMEINLARENEKRVSVLLGENSFFNSDDPINLQQIEKSYEGY